jgi:hypothetical protein
VPLGDMDPDLPRAFIAAEDQRFLSHPGVDLRAGQAVRDNSDRGRSSEPRSRCSWRGCCCRSIALPAAGRRRASTRVRSIKGGDPGAVPQPGAAGTGCHRRVGCHATLLQRRGRAGESRSGGSARRAGTVALQPESAGVPRACERPARNGPRCALLRQSYITAVEAARAGREPVLGVGGRAPSSRPTSRPGSSPPRGRGPS